MRVSWLSCKRCGCWLLLGLAFSGAAQGRQVRADEPPAGKQPPASAGYLDLDEKHRAALTAATIIGVKDGLAAVFTYRFGTIQGAWTAAPVVQKRRSLDPEGLDKSRLIGIEDGKPKSTFKENPDEWHSYNYVIGYAHDVPNSALARVAKADLTFAHLVEHPTRYRGEIVEVTGRLRDLRAFEAPQSLHADGIKDFYEGLIVTEETSPQPYWIVFTEAPPTSIKTSKQGEKLDVPVVFHGYFFKWTRVDRPDGKHPKAALVVGRTLTLRPVPAPPPLERIGFLDSPGFLVFASLAATVGFILGIIYWLKRGDKAVASRLATSRAPSWQPPPPDTNGTSETVHKEPGTAAEPPVS